MRRSPTTVYWHHGHPKWKFITLLLLLLLRGIGTKREYPYLHLAYISGDGMTVRCCSVGSSFAPPQPFAVIPIFLLLFGFSVLHNMHGLRDLNYTNIPYNDDTSIEGAEYWTKWQIYLRNRGYFDWTDSRYDDCPQPSDKRYRWKGVMGHFISDEFEKH